MEIFKNGIAKDWKDFFQSKCLILGATQQQLDNADFIFESSVPCSNRIPCVCPFESKHGPDVVHKGLLLSNESDARWIVEPKVKLSTVMLKTGMVTSKNEFFRKLKQKGITHNNNTLELDMEIDVTVPSLFHEIRLGKRFLEIAVPSLQTDEEHKGDSDGTTNTEIKEGN